MFPPKRYLIGLFLPLVLVGLSISASEALGQKAKETFVYAPPTVSLASDHAVLNACEGDTIASLVRLNARATSPSGNTIRYNWTTSAGRIDGNGADVTWDLSGVKPGYYKAFLAINSGSGDEACEAFSSTAVLVRCTPPAPVCPNVYISCPDRVELDQPVTFTSSLTGGSGNVTPIYNWTVSAGRIIEGEGTSSIKVETTGLAGQTLRATLSMGGYPLDCSASCSFSFPVPPPKCKKFDDFGKISRNDQKARLDNYAIDLQTDRTSTAYVIIYPRQRDIYPGQRDRSGQVQAQMTRIVDYLVNSRGFEAGRIVTIVGPPRGDMVVELWTCPQGATPPTPAPY